LVESTHGYEAAKEQRLNAEGTETFAEDTEGAFLRMNVRVAYEPVIGIGRVTRLLLVV